MCEWELEILALAPLTTLALGAATYQNDHHDDHDQDEDDEDEQCDDDIDLEG